VPRHTRCLERGLLLVLVVAAFCTGCDSARRQWEEARRSPNEWLDVALESPLPDDRRRAVNAIAASREGRSDWAVQAFDSIARTDIDATVRVAALRALRRSAGAATVPLTVKLLQPGPPAEDVRAAPGIVRWEAALLLRDLARRSDVEPGMHESALTALLHRAVLDEDRNVRIAALEALGSFRDDRSLRALVAAMQDRDFAIQSAAEHSLVALTGERRGCDPDEWAAWLAAHPNALAAQPPAVSPRPAGVSG